MSLAALIKKGSLRELATAIPAIPATDEGRQAPTVATIATIAVATAPDRAANDPGKAAPVATGPNQAPYWPNTQHATDSELDTMEARLMLFTQRSMADTEAWQPTRKN